MPEYVTELTQELIESICDIVRMGVDWDVAAVALGAELKTVREWEERAIEAKSGLFMNLFRDVTRAQAESEVIYAAKIAKDDAPGTAFRVLGKINPGKWGNSKKKVIEKPPELLNG